MPVKRHDGGVFRGGDYLTVDECWLEAHGYAITATSLPVRGTGRDGGVCLVLAPAVESSRIVLR